MTDEEYQIEYTTRDLALFLARDFSLGAQETLRKVYNSKTYENFANPKTGLFFQSPLYVYDSLKKEVSASKGE